MDVAPVQIIIKINGNKYECSPEHTILDVAKKNEIHIPTLCYNPLFGENRLGSCRMCLVEVTAGGRPGLQPSCTLPVSHNLEISTNSEKVYQARRAVVELLLSEHVQKCRDCLKSGDCYFSKLCRAYDINGVPVCSECPNKGEGCYLKRGVLCLGPLTFANCNAYCTREGYRCEGCHSILANEDVLAFGIRSYKNAGFTKKDVLTAAKVYSYDSVKRLEKVMDQEGFE